MKGETDLRGVTLAGGAATFGVVLAALLGGCAEPESVPPVAPAAPQVQEVPQLRPGDGTRGAETFCLVPAGSGMRVFVSFDGHGRRIFDVENVATLPEGSPYRCP